MRDYSQLITDLAEGGPEAMDRLLSDAQALARRFSTLVCGNAPDAEDAVQDALLQTYRHAERIRDPGAFRTWLYRTVKNACLMSRRGRVREPLRLLSLDADTANGVAAEGPTPEDRAAALDARTELRRGLSKLPKEYRLVIFLRDIEGLSTGDAASLLGISEDNLKQRLHRARALLKKQLTAAAPGRAARSGTSAK